MLAFLIGVIVGAGLVLFAAYIFLVDPWQPPVPPPPFIDQFKPIQIPENLRSFLKTGDAQGLSKWESCHSISLFLHMIYQEHKDTRNLRRWVYKRLQIELNDITTRSTAGRLIQDIRIRDLALGTQFPSINSIRVESVEMADDKNTFEKIVFVLDIDYTGGFETSIEVTTMFKSKANVSVKITKLAGQVRLILSRKPFNHWTFSFVSAPVFETDISSQYQGLPLKRLIPIMKDSIRRALQRKHVWPNYKIRYRPVFPNPIFQASPPLNAFAHVKTEGGLEITVLQCSRLKTSLVDKEGNYEVYCTATIDQRPFLQNTSSNVAHSLNVMLTFSRFDVNAVTGITFEKNQANSTAGRLVRVETVQDGTLADKAGFKPGDVLVAINNVPIRSERQVNRFLQGTIGDLLVLVDRNLDDIDDDMLKDSEELIGDPNGSPDDAFVSIGSIVGERRESKEASPSSDSLRRHSLSNVPSGASIMDTTTESINSSLFSLDAARFERPTAALVQRAESARVPHVLISQPSMDLRRTRSESQLDAIIDMDEERMSRVDAPPPLGRINTVMGLTPEYIHDQDGTLVQNSKPLSGSAASLASQGSVRTDATDDGEEGEEGKLHRSASTRRQRLHATLQAGKRRVMDMMPQKKRNSASPLLADGSVEVGSEAADLVEDIDNGIDKPPRSPVSSGKRSPLEMHVVDKKEKRKCKKSRSPNPPHKSTQSLINDSPVSTGSSSFARSRSTKAVHFSENVLWGQSLHFSLDGAAAGSPTSTSSKNISKYLNVTVHAREIVPTPTIDPMIASPSMTASTSSNTFREPGRPILLGYVSLYIPQLIDDCQLTLSNCHREVFTLKPPSGIQSINEPLGTNGSEFARHAGFDPRLCYGDVTLGFRYFPEGLPLWAGLTTSDCSDEERRVDDTESANQPRKMTPPPAGTPGSHEWTNMNKGGQVCDQCGGKIWMRSACRCTRCGTVCHHKCVAKADSNGTICKPRTLEHDSQFEELDLDTAMIDAEDECPVTMIHTNPLQHNTPYKGETEAISRRTRLKNKVTEKLSLWKRGKKKDDGDDNLSNKSESLAGDPPEIHSPMASIQDCLSDLLPTLEGSPYLYQLYFQPGNAYNEQTISHAKEKGKHIFNHLFGEERQIKINQQIDKIHISIRETKDRRLAALKDTAHPNNFQHLDERLQALAVLMLHYCAALQDCDAQNFSPSRRHNVASSEESSSISSSLSSSVGRMGVDGVSLLSDDSSLTEADEDEPTVVPSPSNSSLNDPNCAFIADRSTESEEVR